jgi:hypothetical protein
MELASLESLEDRLEERLRELKEELRMWETKEKMSEPFDPVRVASEIQHASAQVRSSLSRLRARQDKYQSVVARWNEDRSNQDLIAQTAALSREMKVDKSELETAVKSAISTGRTSASSQIASLNFSLGQIRERERIIRENHGALRAMEPNIRDRNAERIKSFLKERAELEVTLQGLEQVMPESADREYLREFLR